MSLRSFVRATVGLSGAILLVAGVIACSSTPSLGRQAEPETAGHAATPLELPGVFVSTTWLAEHLHDPRLLVVHVGHGRRGYDERGHIPGAVFLEPRDVLVERDEIPNELPEPETLQSLLRNAGFRQDHRVVLYGEAAGIFPARVYFTLAAAGLDDRVALLDGQLRHWLAEGRAVTTDATASPPGNVTVAAFDSSELATAEHLQEAQRVGGTVLVDARNRRHFAGERKGSGAEAAGHIQGAVHRFWRDQIYSVTDPRLRPLDELRTWYAQAGIEPGSPVIVYSSTGMQAALSYAVLRHLGHEVRLYDGSIADWTQRGLPVLRLESDGNGAAPAAAE